jgi:hypothetical protein
MKNRLEYPLTEAAKQAARELVGAWDAGEVAQYFTIQDLSVEDDFVLVLRGGQDADEEPHRLSAFLELAHYGLISVGRQTRFDPASGREGNWWSILLLQELRDAVADDFALSDFFLATAAPGTVIHLGEGAVVAGVSGAAYGAPPPAGVMPPMENVDQLSDKLMFMMGDAAMEAHPPLRKAIDDLRAADDPVEVRTRAGRVIEEVGRGLVALANAGAAIEAIQLIGHFLG